MASSSDLSGQALPRRPIDDYGEPSELGPLPDERQTSPGRPSRLAGGDASRPPAADVDVDVEAPRSTNIFNECRCGITRADLWIAVFASSAIALVVDELLRVAGLR